MEARHVSFLPNFHALIPIHLLFCLCLYTFSPMWTKAFGFSKAQQRVIEFLFIFFLNKSFTGKPKLMSKESLSCANHRTYKNIKSLHLQILVLSREMLMAFRSRRLVWTRITDPSQPLLATSLSFWHGVGRIRNPGPLRGHI